MEILRTLGRGALNDFRHVIDSPHVTGLLIETDPLLRTLWIIRNSVTDREWIDIDGRLTRELAERPVPDIADLLAAVGWNFGLLQTNRSVPCDPSWRCGFFESWAAGIDAREYGVIFTVLYEPSIDPMSFESLRNQASGSDWRVHLAARPLATAQASPKTSHTPLIGGISFGELGTSTRGTLGGCLDVEGTLYGVTCGHVIAGSAKAVQPSGPDGGSQVVGTCLSSSSFSGAGERCRARTVANAVDAALIDLDVSALTSVRKLGQVTGTVPISDVVEGESVKLSARSGIRTLEVGALALRRSFTIGGVVYCFEDLLEIRRPGRHWGAKGVAARPTEPGDSGAWILRAESGGNGWVGMVIGNDGPSSYAQFAQSVEDWAKNAVRQS